MIDTDDLETWADSAAQLIQEYIDDLEAMGKSNDVAHIEKALLDDYERIKKGNLCCMNDDNLPANA